MSVNDRDGSVIFDFRSVSSEKPCVQKHENAYDCRVANEIADYLLRM
jgi:hypothetical protein